MILMSQKSNRKLLEIQFNFTNQEHHCHLYLLKHLLDNYMLYIKYVKCKLYHIQIVFRKKSATNRAETGLVYRPSYYILSTLLTYRRTLNTAHHSHNNHLLPSKQNISMVGGPCPISNMFLIWFQQNRWVAFLETW